MFRAIPVVSTVLFLASSGLAFAAGPYDGSWSSEAVGSGPSASACTGPMKGTVANNVLHGEITIGKFKPIEVGGPVARGWQLRSIPQAESPANSPATASSAP